MLTSTVENVLNRGLPRSPRAREICRELAGRRVAIDVQGFTRIVVESTGDSIRLTRDPSTPTEAEVSGGPLSLLTLSRPSFEDVLRRGDVTIRGDADLAQRFRELATLLRPDLEEEMAMLIGDVPAHQIGRFARMALQWGRKATSTTVRNVAEYFAHERGDLVPRSEGRQFLQGVDALREDADRFEARLQALEAKRSGSGT